MNHFKTKDKSDNSAIMPHLKLSHHDYTFILLHKLHLYEVTDT